ncbi:MAG: Ig-like domain-containing protein [Bacteroidales bacterium]|nr:Ig-like domain-containing protein [Bacteroidales bacterium]
MRFTKKLLPLFSVFLLLLLQTCGKPEKETIPQINVSPQSSAVFSSGLKMDPSSGSSTVLFSTTDSWSATVTETKAVDWINIQPTSGPAGNVTMTITVKSNETPNERQAKVTITCGGTVSKSFFVTQEGKAPSTVTVSEVKLDKTSLSLKEGESAVLTATVKPDNATDKTVSWTSSNPDIASVADGKVTAIKEGEATITASAGEKSATCKVTVSKNIIAVTDITLDKSSIALKEGESTVLTATVKPDNATDKTVTWTSSNPDIASVADGKVTAIKEGEATITASAGEKSATCKVTVSKNVIAVTDITLDKTSIALKEGESSVLTATVKPDNATDKTVSWTSSNPDIASVADGKVTAIKEGEATITATAGEKSATCKVTVSKNVIVVTDITLDKTSLSLKEGESTVLTATVKPDNATDKTVTWISSDPSIVKVSDGQVTALKEGEATITATAGNKSAFCHVSVSKNVVPVVSVSIDKTSIALKEGESTVLTATVKPDDATDKTVTWSSSNPDIASVADGKVTAIKEGEATITATAGEKSATCKVTVSKNVIAVTDITLDKTSIALKEGESTVLTATVKPDDATDKTVIWTSSDPDIVSVADGKVTAIKEGEATITASAGEKSATCKVTVSKNVIAVTSVTLDKTSLSLKEGESTVLTATVKPDDATDKTVTWTSSDPTVAKVSDGQVTALREGEAVITASAGNKSASCHLTVSKNVIPVVSITLDRTSLELKEGESATLTATVKPDNATDKTVTWTSSDPSIARVSEGKVLAISEGSATITASSGDFKATCLVTVSKNIIPVESVSLSSTSLALNEGETGYLSATVSPDNATDKAVTWASSDPTVAEVNDGQVTALSEGTATITASAGGKSASCLVTVSKNVIPVTSVSLDKKSLHLNKGGSYTLNATIYPSNATVRTISWTSSNASVASVDSNGKVTGTGAGEATITAEADGVSATCEIRVKLPFESLSLDKTSVTMTEGESSSIMAIVKPSDAEYTMTWSSSDDAVASVDNEGTVFAYSAGQATVTCSISPYFVEEGSSWEANTLTASCTITVNPVIPVTSVQLAAEEVTLNVGDKFFLDPKILPENATDKTLDWMVSDPAILSVSPDGWITALSQGFARINVSKNGIFFTGCNVTVVQPVESVTLDRTSARLSVGETLALNATVSPSDATDAVVNWSSSDESIAFVDWTGTVTARGKGTATITAQAGEKSATCQIEVVVAPESITLDKTVLDMVCGQSTTLKATVKPDDAFDKSVIWTSSDTSIVTVSDGKVTAIAKGSATITAKTADGRLSATCSVTVKSSVNGDGNENFGNENGEW